MFYSHSLYFFISLYRCFKCNINTDTTFGLKVNFNVRFIFNYQIFYYILENLNYIVLINFVKITSHKNIVLFNLYEQFFLIFIKIIRCIGRFKVLK